MDIIYLDFQKAFDSLPHKRLVRKLRGYGIDGNILAWISDFLNNRKQRVSVNWGEVTSGVPQGSVLGPTLFILYVNELPSLVRSKIKMFADDTKLYGPVRNHADARIIQDDLNILSAWSNKWLLRFNVSKCKVMHCGRVNPKFSYYMEHSGDLKKLEETEAEMDLGVYISNTMKPTLHGRKAASKAISALQLLRIAFGALKVAVHCTLVSAEIKRVVVGKRRISAVAEMTPSTAHVNRRNR